MALLGGDITIADDGTITMASGTTTMQATLFVRLMEMNEGIRSAVNLPNYPPVQPLTNAGYTKVLGGKDELPGNVAAVRAVANMANAIGGWMYDELTTKAHALVTNTDSIQRYVNSSAVTVVTLPPVGTYQLSIH